MYEPLQRYLRRRCAPGDVDDVLNDTLVVMWRRLDEVPPGGEAPWCYGVARRCLANHRRGARRRGNLVELVRGRAAPAAGPALVSDADADLHDALGRLPELDREVVRLWAWEQLEPREIATVLDLTANAVSIRLTRIKARLASELDGKDRAPAGHITHDTDAETGS